MSTLVLTRKVGQRTHIYLLDGRRIEVFVSKAESGRVRLCIEAPIELQIYRAEIDPNENEVKP